MFHRSTFRRSMFAFGAVALLSVAAACSSQTEQSTTGTAADTQARTSSQPSSAGTSASLATDSSSDTSAADTGDTADAQHVKLLTNYLAQAEQGGYWDAMTNQYARDNGITIDVTQGSPGIATVPQVAAGTFEFGVANADDILIARKSGMPLVAVAGGIDRNLFVLMSHKEANITEFSQLNGHLCAVRSAAPYWDYVVTKYGLKDATPVNFTGSMATFKVDPSLVQQGYATADVYLAKKAGIDINVLDVGKDAGYNPYMQVLFTTESLIESKPELVQSVVSAVVKGWKNFAEDASDAKTAVLKANQEADPEIFDASATTLQDGDYVLQTGKMEADRWTDLRDQLASIDLVPSDFDVASAWTSKFTE